MTQHSTIVAVVPLPSGATALRSTLAALAGAPEVLEILLPHCEPLPQEVRRDLEASRFGARIRLARCGEGRLPALRAALEQTSGVDRLLVLDANRRALSGAGIGALVGLGQVHDALVAALPVKSTFKQVRGGRILWTVPRERLFHLQPPVLFRRSVLEAAVNRALEAGRDCPDEVAAAWRAGVSLRIVTGDALNIPVATSAEAAAAVGGGAAGGRVPGFAGGRRATGRQGQRVAVVVLAAGAGRRMGAPVNKVFLPLDGRPILSWTLETLQACEGVDEVVLVTAAAEREECRKRAVEPFGITKVTQIVAGGASRCESERLGLEALAPQIEAGRLGTALVHDAARPLVGAGELASLIVEARRSGAAILAVPGTPGIFSVDEQGLVEESPAGIWAAQTPQAFDARLLLDAHRRAAAAGVQGTDTASIVEWAGHPVTVVEGAYDNIKVTTAEDLVLAEHIARRRSGPSRLPPGEELLHL